MRCKYCRKKVQPDSTLCKPCAARSAAIIRRYFGIIEVATAIISHVATLKTSYEEKHLEFQETLVQLVVEAVSSDRKTRKPKQPVAS